MLGFGRGWGISAPDGTLAASTLALPYGSDFAWVAMVLVLPEHRRKGYASRLLRVALAEMEKQKRVRAAGCDPRGARGVRAGRVSRLLGFQAVCLEFGMPFLERGRCETPGKRSLACNCLRSTPSHSAAAGRRCCAISPRASRKRRSWPSATGRSPDSCWLAKAARRCRSGRSSRATTARRANCSPPHSARCPPPVYVDIADHAASLQAWALAQGFAVQRPFTRMAHGPRGYAPGDASLVFCPAGPELG